MKKLLYLAFSLTMLLTSVGAMAKTENVSLTPKQEQRLAEITQRVEEIKAMNKSNLSREEKKSLRSELVEMKKESKALSGGVYLSVTAIIIVLLVLILIL